MKKTLLIAAMFASFAVVSCKKDQSSGTTTAITLNDVKVPAGFTWESSRNLNVSVALTDTRFGALAQNIEIYNGNPYAGGQLLSKGAATTSNAFATKIYLPTTVTQLFVKKTAPDNSTIVEQVAAPGSANVSLTMGATDPSFAPSGISGNGKQTLGTAPTSPDCSGGTAITTNTNNLNVNSGDTYSITADNITVGFSNVNGGTIKVCGKNVTLSNLSFNGAATLIVTSTGSINLTPVSFNNTGATVQNFGTINYTGSFPDGGVFYNSGIFNSGGDFNLNSGAGIFTNNGTLNIGGSFNNGASAVATNNGAMTVGGNFQPNSGSSFVNNCNLTVGGNYTQNASVKNYSLIRVGGVSTINSGAELGLYNGAMLYTAGFIVDGSVAGYGSTSLIEITGSTTIRNQGSVVSNVEVYSPNFAFDATSLSKIVSPASSTDHGVYIAKSTCNPIGNGTAQVLDTDGDGVSDLLDQYPKDPTRAYNVAGAIGTVAFEDEWPVKGDFDMNDIVMGYSYTLVTSAANVVVSVNGSYTLYARGGDYTNAFGIEFPISATQVSGLAISKNGVSVSNPAFEGGQAKAVAILFTNMKDEMATYNTKTGDIFSAYKTYSLSFNISNGPTLSTFGQDEYNPFIYNSGRGHEVHVAGKTPTSLADATLFGTNDDNTNVGAGRYYVTKTGLPYAINLPVVPFSYPAERIDITLAYPHIIDWATSGGVNFTDWYSNTGAGYRNLSNIFTH